MNRRGKMALLALVLVFAFFAYYGENLDPTRDVTGQCIEEELAEILGLDELTDGYYTIIDDEGNQLMRTARIISVGNQFHTQDNRLYEVHTVEDQTAYARFVKQIDLASQTATVSADSIPVQQEGTRAIAIYHSHGAESYVPSDGSESIEEGGGILQVGEIFSRALEEQQVQVHHSTETHVPHDAGAYTRSRRTVEELMQENPDALFDVHRDAVPAEEYTATIDGEQIAQIQLVVGQQNQNQATIQEFAEGLKRVADETYPGLIKGIFYASGNYNQDLSPRSILLEVGTHENQREHAETSIQLFAEATTAFLYGEGATATEERAQTAGIASSTIFWLLLLAALAGGGYLWLSTGSVDKAVEKVRQFTKTEFLNFLGQKQKKPRTKKDHEKEED